MVARRVWCPSGKPLLETIMIAKIYIDKGEPLVSVHPETLTDGSIVWDMHIRGGETIHCLTEARADAALNLIAQALELAVGEKPLVL